MSQNTLPETSKLNLKDLIAMPDNAGIRIPYFEATVVQVNKRGMIKMPAKGGGVAKELQLQEDLLGDEGLEISAMLSNCPDFPFVQGNRVAFLNITTVLRDVVGLKKLVLGVREKSGIFDASDLTGIDAYFTANPPPAQVTTTPAQPASAPTPAAQAQPPRQSSPPPPGKATIPPPARQYPDQSSEQVFVDKAADYLQRVGNFYRLAMEEAHYQRLRWNKDHPDFPMPPEQFEKMVAGFCMGADRAFIPSTMPTGDLDNFVTSYRQPKAAS